MTVRTGARRRGPRLALAGVLTLALLAFSPLAGSAQAKKSNAMSTCRASVVRIVVNGGVVAEPVVVQNAAGQRCTAMSQSTPINIPGVLSVTANRAETTVSGKANHPTSEAELLELGVAVLGVPLLSAGVLNATATAGACVGGSPSLSGSSSVTDLSVLGGEPISINTPTSIPILGLVSVALNQTTIGPGNQITQRALTLSLNVLGLTVEVVIGEAQAGFAAATC